MDATVMPHQSRDRLERAEIPDDHGIVMTPSRQQFSVGREFRAVYPTLMPFGKWRCLTGLHVPQDRIATVASTGDEAPAIRRESEHTCSDLSLTGPPYCPRCEVPERDAYTVIASVRAVVACGKKLSVR